MSTHFCIALALKPGNVFWLGLEEERKKRNKPYLSVEGLGLVNYNTKLTNPDNAKKTFCQNYLCYLLFTLFTIINGLSLADSMQTHSLACK